MVHRKLALVVGLAIGSTLPAFGQTLLHTLTGPAPLPSAGLAVAGTLDLDGDGRGDALVGAPEQASVRVYSGRLEGVLRILAAGDPDGGFGRAVSGVADLDGDLLAEIAVGAPEDDANGVDSGSVWVYSGADGALLFTFVGDGAGDRLGAAVTDAGDVNGDGWHDILVGAPGDDDTGSDAGSARVYSGATGYPLLTVRGDAAGDLFGSAVSATQDLSGDARPDLVIGAPGDDAQTGSVWVLAGSDGAVLHTLSGAAAGDRFGSAVSGLGDTDGDGTPDIGTGAPGVGGDRGSVSVHSGADGSLLVTAVGKWPQDFFGTSLAAPGDLDGDGRADLLVGAPQTAPVALGYVQALRGEDGSLLWGRDDAMYCGENFGQALAALPDVDGDGVSDAVVGFDPNYSGSVWLLSGRTGSIEGVLGTDGFGYQAEDAGDVNGDGYDDVIVAQDLGAARVFSGIDGSVLWELPHATAEGGLFGSAVDGAGDVDGDGYADLIIGAWGDDTGGEDAGSARVVSGVDGAVLFEVHGALAGGALGWSVAGAGDVNGDGLADVVVGAPGYTNGKPGLAQVHAGPDGSLLHAFQGESSDRLGWAVGAAGDVNGDGRADLIIGEPLHDSPQLDVGRALVMSGLDGAQLFEFVGPEVFAEYGRSVSGGGDLNGDGVPDLLLGAWGSATDTFPGRVLAFSGLDGSQLYTFKGAKSGQRVGWTVRHAGDVNGDGLDDLVWGAPAYNVLQSKGRARVYSGADRTLLLGLKGEQDGDWLGYAVGGGGDLNGDGFADVIVASPVLGQAQVWSGYDDQVGSPYCGPAVDNSTGSPAWIEAHGASEVSQNRLALHARGLPLQKFGYFLVSGATAFTSGPGGSQGNLCLGSPLGRYASAAQSSGLAGFFSMKVNLNSLPFSPPVAVQPGDTWNFQCWYRDQNPGSTSNFTDALAVTFD